MASQRWLYGPVPDLLCGCGLVYCIAFAALVYAGPEIREALPFELTPLIVLLTGIPHYGATLLRVYERPEDRRRYAVFGVLATLLVWGAFAVGVYHVGVGSLLLTVYLTWSPWHYSGQNYGVAMMFLRRRGVAISARTRRLFHASFVLSFVLTFLALHGAAPGVLYAPGEYQRSVYRIVSLGIPYGVIQITLPLCFGVYVACLGAAARGLRRGGSWRDAAPALLLAGSQSLWFTVPLLARYAGVLQDVEPLGTEQATYAFLWIAVAHALQYLWITSYYARRAPVPPRSQLRYFARALLAGAAIWVVPSLLFAPGVLGRVPYDAGLGALVAAAVNIHHFVLDGAIWKLRDGRIASILLRGQAEADATPSRAAGVWVPRAVWATGALAVVVLLWTPLEQTYGLAGGAQRFDLARVETAQQRLAWMGRASGLAHVTIASMYQDAGNAAAAERHAAAARELAADYATLGNLAVYYVKSSRIPEAIATLREALELEPGSPDLADKLAWLLATSRPGDAASAREAIELAERASQARPVPRYLATLAVAYATAGRLDDATGAARRAQTRARADGDAQLDSWLGGQIEAWQGMQRRSQ